MKYTLCITHQCNLACEYCYVGKRQARMSTDVAEDIIDFAFCNTPPGEKIDIGFFGGEPLLEFKLITEIVDIIENHPDYDRKRVMVDIVTNGTIFSDEIAGFVREHGIGFGISCDGPPEVQDTFRRFREGGGSSKVVETNIRRALEVFPHVMVNSVHHPRTIEHLVDVVDYFASLGLTQIYLNPDYSADWSVDDMKKLAKAYDEVAGRYMDFYRDGNPHYISQVDGKIAVILRGGYQPMEKCRMGKGEFAFTPEGRIYPCERLIGDGTGDDHCIGNIDDGIKSENLACHTISDQAINSECLSCGIKNYCMNWCGCSNHMGSGYYNRVSPFICFSERAAIESAFNVFQILEAEYGQQFCEHLTGYPSLNSARPRRV